MIVQRVDYGGCGAWVRGVLGNLDGLCVMGLIHFEDSLRSFITFSIIVIRIIKGNLINNENTTTQYVGELLNFVYQFLLSNL